MGHTVYELTGELIDGMNEKGFSLCVASNDYDKYQSREPYPNEPAVVMWHMMQILLQTCATVDEALDLLRGVRVWFPEEGNHWLLADATGKSVIVEWTPGEHKLVVFDKPDAYKLMTNTAAQEGEDYLLKNCPRYAKAKPILERGVSKADDMFDVVGAMRIAKGPGRSLWTCVMDLNDRTMAVRYFKEYEQTYEFKF
jgi:penicillin V acylase-like amidase (Ntn superfamily)